MLGQLETIVQDEPARPHRGQLSTGDAAVRHLQPPVTRNASWRHTYWRFPSLIAAPPRQHGLGSASFFRPSAGAKVRLGGVGVNGGWATLRVEAPDRVPQQPALPYCIRLAVRWRSRAV